MSDVQRVIEKIEEANAYIIDTGAGAGQHAASAAALEAIRILKDAEPQPRASLPGSRIVIADPFGTWRCPDCGSALLRIRSVGAYFELTCALGHPLHGEPGTIRTVGVDEQADHA